MAAPALSPSSRASADRRGATPSPRPLRAVSSYQTETPDPVVTASQQQAATVSRLIGQQQRSFAPGLNTQTNRQPSQSAPNVRRNRPSRQSNPLGNLLARQQFDEGSPYDEEGDGSSEPDYLSMNEPDIPEQQSSVLDMANQGFSPYQSSANDNEQLNESSNDNDLSPADQTKARNRAFQMEQAQNQARQQHFIPQASATSDGASSEASGGTQPRLNVRQFGPNTDYTQQRRIERFEALSRRFNPNAEAEDGTKTSPPVIGDAEQVRSDMKELGRLGRRIATIFTGVGIPEAFAEQNFVVINNALNNRVQIPGIADRPPNTGEQSTLSRMVDGANKFVLGIEYVMIPLAVLGSIVMFLISALPFLLPLLSSLLGAAYIAQLLGVDAGTVLQLAH